MHKLINNVDDVVQESLLGFLDAHGQYFKKVEDVNGLVFKKGEHKKVRIVTGGGSGHEPIFIGLAGEGMADGIALGNVFASPDPNTILNVIKEVSTEADVLCLVLNYAGDTMNFSVASELASAENINVKSAIISDDVASSPKGSEEERRGVAGLLLVTKVAGAAANLGYDLERVHEIATKANANIRSIGIALSPCSLPGSEPNFEIPENEYEFGMGIHGEPGIRREKIMPADKIIEKMMEEVLHDFDSIKNEEVVVLVNGMGPTTTLELNIANRKVNEILRQWNIRIHDNIVNSYCNSLDMAGVSISILKLDEELKKLYAEPAYTPYYFKK